MENEIRELLNKYASSLNADDAALAASCYSVDGIFMPTNLPTSAGQELLKAYKMIFEKIHLSVTFTIDELVVTSDDSAYALTRSNGTQTINKTGLVTKESNREVFLFKKIGNDWKITHYMFNKSE